MGLLSAKYRTSTGLLQTAAGDPKPTLIDGPTLVGCCPKAAVHRLLEDWWGRLDSCHLLSEFIKMGQRGAQRSAGHLKDPFERPIECEDQKNCSGD